MYHVIPIKVMLVISSGPGGCPELGLRYTMVVKVEFEHQTSVSTL